MWLHQVGDLLGSLRLHAGDDVGVLLESERRRRVPEPLANDVDRLRRLQQQRRAGMTQTVELDWPHLRRLCA